MLLRLFLLLLVSSVMMKGYAQQTKRVCDTIPYEFLEDKIVIPVVVNGVKVKYILDTGGQTGTMWEDAVKMQVEATGTSVNVADLNGEGMNHQKGVLKAIQLSPNYMVDRLETMVLPEVGLFKALGVAGILGGDAFAGAVLTIDPRKQVIVINYPYRPERLKITDGIAIVPNNQHHIIFKMKFGTVEKNVLFDTGAGGFLLISQEDFSALKEAGEGISEATAFGINGIGLAGLTKPIDFEKGYVKKLSLLGKNFKHVGCITNPSNMTLIGVDLLKYGKVVVDYLRDRFYFFPFSAQDEDMGRTPKTWNVSILPANERFEITAVWGDMSKQVAVGDQVVNINGQDLEGLPMSQLEIDKIMNSIEGDSAYIIIQKDGQKSRIEIRKE